MTRSGLRTHPTTTSRARTGAAAVALGLSLTLTGCSASDPSPTSADAGADAGTADPTAHDESDIAFAQMMIVHHEGAIEMAQLAVDQASDEEVRALAERIMAAQGPEIELMSGWLETWGEEPMTGMDGMDGMDHGEMDGMDHSGMSMGSMEMDGMDQGEAMAELSGLSGTDLDRRFLELMVLHHQGAVEMAEMQTETAGNAEVRDFAGRVVQDQQREIAEMEELLQGL